MPVRKIGLRKFSVVSNFTSIKTASDHMCESTLETDYCYHLEFDDSVVSYETQPVKLNYINQKGRKSKYVPDFKVVFNNSMINKTGFKFLIIEIKYEDDLKANQKEFENKFKSAQEFCEIHGGKFEVITEKEIRNQRLESYKFLYRYLDQDKVPKLKIDFISLANKLKKFNAFEWVNNIEGDDYLKGQALFNLWSMVARGELKIDLDSKITNLTIIERR